MADKGVDTMIDTPEFKPCPFCGGKVYPHLYGYEEVSVRVRCGCDASPQVCSAELGPINIPTLVEMMIAVAAKWNRRFGG